MKESLNRSGYRSTPLTSALIRECIWIKSGFEASWSGTEDICEHKYLSILTFKVSRRKVGAKQTRGVSPPLEWLDIASASQNRGNSPQEKPVQSLIQKRTRRVDRQSIHRGLSLLQSNAICSGLHAPCPVSVVAAR